MQRLFSNLWLDEFGFVVSTELVLVATILVIGVTVGHSTLRNAVVIELADMADSISNSNQSYSFTTVTGHSSSIAGSLFSDDLDFCDGVFGSGAQGTDGGFGSEGQCVNLALDARDEGT